MAIEEDSILQLKTRLDIVDIIGRYIELKKDGAGYKANCPFHDEKTASFKVSPSKQIYHCFGCGAGGDSIKFVMDYEHLNYPEAIEKLANEYNIALRYTNDNFKKERIDLSLLEELNHFFQRELQSFAPAKEYLKNRGVYESSIEKFELGYAPRSEKTVEFLKSKGMSEKKGLELGVIAKDPNGRIYARFSKRVIFPIFNPGGKIVGFGGRIIDNRENVGKYINSPDTKFFDKGSLLYGYHKATDSIRKRGRVIVVEGNLDVVMLHQAGWTNTVATLGTAFTPKVIPLLKRGEPEVILAYDGDRAGIEAAFKAAKMLSVKSIQGGVVIFEEGKDPADMVKSGELDELKRLFNHSKRFIDFCLEKIVSQYNINNPLEKEKALKEAQSYLFEFSPLIQNEYRAFLASLLHISENLIKIGTNRSDPSPNSFLQTKEDVAELSIIKTLLVNPNMIDRVLDTLTSQMFAHHKKEFELLIGYEIEHPLLRGINIRDDIVVYENDEFEKQLLFMLRRYYSDELNRLRFRKDLSFEQKSYFIRKIRDIISRLQRGEMVSYESFGTI